jgi:hypothetical protein
MTIIREILARITHEMITIVKGTTKPSTGTS